MNMKATLSSSFGLTIMLIASMSLLFGCAAISSGSGQLIGTLADSNTVAAAQNAAQVAALFKGEANAAAVVCGLTRVDPAKYGGWAGECPGCDVDAGVFALACASNGVGYELLQNGQCTAEGIRQAAERALANVRPGGLLILYYSGHGGQVSDPGDASETDGRSETICLWDGQLSDNIVWDLLCRVPEGIRIWMITDSCHSGTNYRGVHDYGAGIRSRASSARSREPDLLHWGGCDDAHSSFGTSQGGTFTTALVDAYVSGQSYADWFARAARRMPSSQIPICAYTGRDFSAGPIFR